MSYVRGYKDGRRIITVVQDLVEYKILPTPPGAPNKKIESLKVYEKLNQVRLFQSCPDAPRKNKKHRSLSNIQTAELVNHPSNLFFKYN